MKKRFEVDPRNLKIRIEGKDFPRHIQAIHALFEDSFIYVIVNYDNKNLQFSSEDYSFYFINL